MLKFYVQQFDFTHLDFDIALRQLLARFRLPGEAQKVREKRPHRDSKRERGRETYRDTEREQRTDKLPIRRHMYTQGRRDTERV